MARGIMTSLRPSHYQTQSTVITVTDNIQQPHRLVLVGGDDGQGHHVVLEAQRVHDALIERKLVEVQGRQRFAVHVLEGCGQARADLRGCGQQCTQQG